MVVSPLTHDARHLTAAYFTPRPPSTLRGVLTPFIISMCARRGEGPRPLSTSWASRGTPRKWRQSHSRPICLSRLSTPSFTQAHTIIQRAHFSCNINHTLDAVSPASSPTNTRSNRTFGLETCHIPSRMASRMASRMNCEP